MLDRLLSRSVYDFFAVCQQRTLTPPDTWFCPTLRLASVLMMRPISSERVMFPDFPTSLGTSVLLASILGQLFVSDLASAGVSSASESPRKCCLSSGLPLTPLELWFDSWLASPHRLTRARHKCRAVLCIWFRLWKHLNTDRWIRRPLMFFRLSATPSHFRWW